MAGLADYTIVLQGQSGQLDNTHRSVSADFTLPVDVDTAARAILALVVDTDGAAKDLRVKVELNGVPLETTDGYTGAVFQTIHEVVPPVAPTGPKGHFLQPGPNNKVTVSVVPATVNAPIVGTMRFSDVVLWWRHTQQ